MKYTDLPFELCFYHGLLGGNGIEDQTFWKAKLAAEKSGDVNWGKAIAILTGAHWEIVEEPE